MTFYSIGNILTPCPDKIPKQRVPCSPAEHQKVSLPNYGFIMLCRHFSSMDLILSFPGVCYQFSSLFTVRSCVLQLYDTQCSIRITLCMVTEKALAYGKHHYRALQASESALIMEALSNQSHPLSCEEEA